MAADRWRRFFQSGWFQKNLSAHAEAAVPAIRHAKTRIGAQRLQMVRYQVVRTVQSFVSNRQNDFRQVGWNGPAWTIEHRRPTINRRQAWFHRHDVAMTDGTIVPPDIRKLARRIMRSLAATIAGAVADGPSQPGSIPRRRKCRTDEPLSAVPSTILSVPVTNREARRDVIVDALDFLQQGV
mgnify:CR=1 FL=1